MTEDDLTALWRDFEPDMLLAQQAAEAMREAMRELDPWPWPEQEPQP